MGSRADRRAAPGGPDFEVYSEENPQDIRCGESFAAEVINRVMSGPAWPHTLLIWLYDEHGGYYDHVPPPEAVPPDDVPAHNYVLDLPGWLRTLLSPVCAGGFARLKAIDDGPRDYARYGFRVPAVVVSPYARPDYVCSTTLDHTSVLKLIQEKWNLPPLTRRDAAAAARGWAGAVSPARSVPSASGAGRAEGACLRCRPLDLV